MINEALIRRKKRRKKKRYNNKIASLFFSKLGLHTLIRLHILDT